MTLILEKNKKGELGCDIELGVLGGEKKGVCFGIDLLQALELEVRSFYILPQSYDVLLNETEIQVSNGNKYINIHIYMYIEGLNSLY